MYYLLKELKELYQASLAVVCFYLKPAWLNDQLKKHNAIEFAITNVKKSMALMVIIVTTMSLLFESFEFVQQEEKPAEIFVVLLVHGAMVSLILAGISWLWFKDAKQVGWLVAWFILVYWMPLWFWNMLFELHVGFAQDSNVNLFLQLAHEEELLDWQVYFLAVTWLHATAVGIFGLHRMYSLKSHYLWLLGLSSAALYLASFLLVHKTQKAVEILYVIFGMD